MITCIVIDDDANTTKVFSDILELIGLRVVGKGYDGNDAVSLYKKHRPNVVFIDIVMPHADGFYALEKIREFDPNAKVVAVTADFTVDVERRLKELSVTAIIRKPFDQNEIRQVLIHKYQISTS
ncbi:MAG: response regulator [Candidatus Nitrosotenuis sp.]|nr:MAG: response regulator [Candidatus Nitrosotenuis sp.]